MKNKSCAIDCQDRHTILSKEGDCMKAESCTKRNGTTPDKMIEVENKDWGIRLYDAVVIDNLELNTMVRQWLTVTNDNEVRKKEIITFLRDWANNIEEYSTTKPTKGGGI